MYLTCLGGVALVSALVMAAPQPAHRTLRDSASVRARQANAYPSGQAVPQLLTDNPDLFFWPSINDTEGITPLFASPESQSDGTFNAQSWVGTSLFGYDQCSDRNLAESAINDAYYDMWYLTNIDGVGTNIDWNSAAAFEFLGPPANNQDQREHIQQMLNSAAGTSAGWSLFPYWIHVRCDDPANQCNNNCNPDGSQKTAQTIAYTQQEDDNGYTSINFCPIFFKIPRLRDSAINNGKNKPFPFNLNVQSYDNSARVFLHELLHADYFMQNSGSTHVYDLNMNVLSGDGTSRHYDVYGPTMTKIMAKFQPLPNNGNNKAGYYVEKNADNMAWYATAIYVQSKIGTYPHIPIVYRKIDGPPVKIPSVTSTFNDASENATYTLDSLDDGISLASDSCIDLLGSTGTNDAPQVPVGGVAPDSAYSDDYNSQLAQWISDLENSSTDPTSTASPAPSQTCTGNQVEGSCTSDVLPSAAPFSGPQAPSCAKADGSPGSAPRLSATQVATAASDYCDSLAASKIVLGANGDNPKSGIFAGEAEGGKSMVMTVLFDESACPIDKSMDSLDFSTYPKSSCVNGFSTTFAEVCVQDSTWQNYNPDFTVMGGVWGNDCAIWSLQGQ